jgi:hypothetical protein
MSYGMRRALPSAASLDLVGWTIPVEADHVHRHGYLGSDPPHILKLVALE